MQDTPIGRLIVKLQIKVLRFRCHNQNCEQQTFAEQHQDIVGRRRQRTHRLMSNLTQIGLALGGKAGAKLAGKLAMRASASTLLRLLHQLKVLVTGHHVSLALMIGPFAEDGIMGRSLLTMRAVNRSI